MRRPKLESLAATAAGVVLVALHYLIFGGFFPNEYGTLGHDYAYFLTHLLDGFFWYQANGPLAVPWFTPSFCGGVPKFANPQALYYSVPQLLTFAVDPLTSIKMTLLIFSGLGFSGFYLLQRRVFSLSRHTALLGGTLFLFNTLYSSRMLIGHVTFHSFMLGPLIFLLLLRPVRAGAADRGWRLAFDIVCAALLIAYVAVTSLPHVLLPILGGAVFAALLQTLLSADRSSLHSFAVKFALSGLLALGLCAAKLAAAQSLLNHFPRTLYPLPGIASIFELARLSFASLFFSAPESLIRDVVVNSRWHLGPHEFEYGITFVPLWILLSAVLLNLRRLGSPHFWRRPDPTRSAALLGVCALLLLPLALNYYSPSWNALLKGLPIIGNSSVLFRWLSIYIPCVTLLTMIALERTDFLRQYRSWISTIGIAIVILQSAAEDRSYYRQQDYDPRAVLASYERVRSGSWAPAVTRIEVSRNKAGRESLEGDRNDALTRGASQLLCYETLFGFRLESFPRGALKEGPALERENGFFNLKNPSCYVFPEENGCSPGDHFRADQGPDAAAFARYQGFAFEVSRRQKLANGVSLTCLTASLALLAACGLRRAAQRPRKPRR